MVAFAYMPPDLLAAVLWRLQPVERGRARAACRSVYAAPSRSGALRVWPFRAGLAGDQGPPAWAWWSGAREVEIVVVVGTTDTGGRALLDALFPALLPAVETLCVTGPPTEAAAVARRVMQRTTGLRAVHLNGAQLVPGPCVVPDVPAVSLATALRHRTRTVVLDRGELLLLPAALAAGARGSPDTRKLVLSGVYAHPGFLVVDRVLELFPALECIEYSVVFDGFRVVRLPPVGRVLLGADARSPAQLCDMRFDVGPETTGVACTPVFSRTGFPAGGDVANRDLLPTAGAGSVTWTVPAFFDLRRGQARTETEAGPTPPPVPVVVPGVSRVAVVCCNSHHDARCLTSLVQAAVFPDAEELAADCLTTATPTGIGRAFPAVRRLRAPWGLSRALLDSEFPAVDEVLVFPVGHGFDGVLAAMSERAGAWRRVCVVHTADPCFPPAVPPPPGVAFPVIDLSEPPRWTDWLATAPAVVRAEVRHVLVPEETDPAVVLGALHRLPCVTALTLVTGEPRTALALGAEIWGALTRTGNRRHERAGARLEAALRGTYLENQVRVIRGMRR